MTRGAVLVEQLDAITRDGLVLAPETVAAIGAAEARQQPLDRDRALGDRACCWRGSCGGSSDAPASAFHTLSLQYNCDKCDFVLCYLEHCGLVSNQN